VDLVGRERGPGENGDHKRPQRRTQTSGDGSSAHGRDHSLGSPGGRLAPVRGPRCVAHDAGHNPVLPAI
jgi:hypothetical protein